MTDDPLAENPFRHATWRTYTPADGLASHQVEHVEQDGQGFLWFATSNSGVSRFDGEEFVAFTRHDGLSGNQVMHTLCDRRGRLWFATIDGGVCWYDGSSFHSFTDSPLANGMAMCLFEDREGSVWCGGRELLCRCDGEQVHDLLPECRSLCGQGMQYCYGIAQDADGDIWVGTEHLVRRAGNRWVAYGPEDGLPANPGGGGAYSVGSDAEGRVWVGGQGQVLVHEAGGFRTALERDCGLVRKIRRADDGRMWFATMVGAWCQDGERLHRVGAEEGLPHHMITDVMRDREGLLWFTSWGDGVSCCDPEAVQRVRVDGAAGATEDRKAPTGYHRMATDRKGDLWLVGTAGIARWNGECLEQLSDEAVGGVMMAAVDGDGCLWLCGAGGLRRWDGERMERPPFPEGQAGERTRSVAPDLQGRMLVGHQHWATGEVRVSRYDGHRFGALVGVAGRQNEHIYRIAAARDGAIWFALGEWGGPVGSEGKVGRWDADDTVSWLDSAEQMADPQVEDMLEDRQGRMWLATRGGLSRLEGEQSRHFTVKDGLPVDGLLCLHEDDRGDLWMGTESGVIHHDGQHFHTIRSWEITGSVRQILQDRAGAFWFATGQGLVRYTPTRVAPRVRVLRVEANRSWEAPTAVEVPSGSGQIAFEFRGISCRTPPSDMLYACRLEGLERDWQPAVRAGRAVYAELPPGEYTFQVKALDRDANESEPAHVEVQVVPDLRVQALTQALSSSDAPVEFVGSSAALRAVQKQLAEVAATNLTVLLLGETGTGKGLAARALHAVSPLRDGPFIQVNCGALPEALVEGELFGHEKGAFTGAISRKLGKVELAEGGILFLDEIGDMSLEAQVKLLRLLEERTFERVGGDRTLQSGARIVAATNRDLEQMVGAGSFREDLFYRLQVFPVRLPPLRERREDIEILVLYFAQAMATHLSKPIAGLAPDALAALRAHDWPGNVRELEHVVRRAVIACGGPLVRAGDLVLPGTGRLDADADTPIPPEEYERRYLTRALEKSGWLIKGAGGAAALLGMPESTLRSKMKRLGIRRE